MSSAEVQQALILDTVAPSSGQHTHDSPVRQEAAAAALTLGGLKG